ncbi:MAG TPA: hypothetical protein VNO70_04215, partial [Blastocatellia bacterium]|nr:hypothetical protein [Blastocatellia bacterium]
LPHYREGALAACRNLDPALARAALRMADDWPLDDVLERLQRDPWFNPALAGRSQSGAKQLRVVRWAGAFRGFGGLFPLPPILVAAAGDFVISDTESRWLLTADIFGATFHRLGPGTPGEKSAAAQGFSINRQGTVSRGEYKATFPELADCASFAANDTTLAVTVPLSHSVYLVALTGD